MSIEVTSVRHCDRCGITMENTWTVVRWKSDDLSDLCKECTIEFNKWLKAKPLKDQAKKVTE